MVCFSLKEKEKISSKKEKEKISSKRELESLEAENQGLSIKLGVAGHHIGKLIRNPMQEIRGWCFCSNVNLSPKVLQNKTIRIEGAYNTDMTENVTKFKALSSNIREMEKYLVKGKNRKLIVESCLKEKGVPLELLITKINCILASLIQMIQMRLQKWTRKKIMVL